MSTMGKILSAPWALALLVAFPSSGIVHKYTGTLALLAYLLGVIATFSLLKNYGLPCSAWFRKNFKIAAAGAFLAATACFAVLYPIENSKGPGKSSDRDQGLNISATRLLHGEYPYYENEPTAGPLSVLPGSILLATPFVAVGNSAFQNLFWLSALVALASWLFADRLVALALIAISLALTPSGIHEYISGGDLMSNGIFVAVFSILALRAWALPCQGNSWRWLSLLLMGLALASRPNFLFILPPFAALLWRETSLPKALIASTTVFLAFLAITLPFYLIQPDGFTPLVARAKIAIHGMPWASAAVVGITAGVTIAASLSLLLRKNHHATTAFAQHCAIVILAPMIAMIILQSISSGSPDFAFMRDRFGLMYLPFALIGWRLNLVDGKATPPHHAA